jgi:hypothetical protein
MNNNFNSPLITNGRINFENNNNINLYNNNIKNYFKNDINNDDIEYNFENKNSNLTNIIFNGSMQQSNGKKIRDKIIRCSSMLTKNNIYEDENEDDNSSIPKNKNQSTLVNNYNNNIPIKHYDLNSSQYETQYINMDNTNIINNINVNNSISSINNQSEFINYKSSSMNKESNSDFLFYALQNNNKRDDSEAPQKKKNIIRIKKNKLSNSIKLENGEKNSLINQNQSIYVNKSKKKSNGKKFNIVNSTNINDYNKTITISKKNSDLLIKNLKYKCLNGKAKNIDIKNENIIILSKHKKNYDNDANINFNYADKLTTCSIPQINNTINNNNVITNSDYKNKNKILSELALHKKKKSTKISSKKLSFTGNNSKKKKNNN